MVVGVVLAERVAVFTIVTLGLANGSAFEIPGTELAETKTMGAVLLVEEAVAFPLPPPPPPPPPEVDALGFGAGGGGEGGGDVVLPPPEGGGDGGVGEGEGGGGVGVGGGGGGGGGGSELLCAPNSMSPLKSPKML